LGAGVNKTMCVLGVRQLVLGQKLRVRSPQEYQ